MWTNFLPSEERSDPSSIAGFKNDIRHRTNEKSCICGAWTPIEFLHSMVNKRDQHFQIVWVEQSAAH
jgi:hypothetical protein